MKKTIYFLNEPKVNKHLTKEDKNMVKKKKKQMKRCSISHNSRELKIKQNKMPLHTCQYGHNAKC